MIRAFMYSGIVARTQVSSCPRALVYRGVEINSKIRFTPYDGG